MKEKKFEKYIQIPAWKALAYSVTLLGLFFVYNVQRSKREEDIYRAASNYFRRLSVDISRDPIGIEKDINGDGKEELIMKLRSGEDLILYKTPEGYRLEERIKQGDK